MHCRCAPRPFLLFKARLRYRAQAHMVLGGRGRFGRAIHHHGKSLDYRSSEARSARRLVLMAVMMATFMAAMESSIVATAMPSIVAALGGVWVFRWGVGGFF